VNNITIRDLKLAARTTPSRISLELMLINLTPPARLYARFVELIEDALDWVAQELARNPELKQGQTEDQITQEVILALRAVDFDAKHGTRIGGHCDITIEGRDEFLWLGEAKIHKNTYKWLFAGFQQLSTRYSTGGADQDAGGILIYCFGPRVDRIMMSWRRYMKGRIGGVTIVRCERNPLALRSSHVHERTGRPFNIRHVPISLYFQPKH
jgi:hypothetical protein